MENTKSHWNNVKIKKLKDYVPPKTDYFAPLRPNQNNFCHLVEVLWPFEDFWAFCNVNLAYNFESTARTQIIFEYSNFCWLVLELPNCRLYQLSKKMTKLFIKMEHPSAYDSVPAMIMKDGFKALYLT